MTDTFPARLAANPPVLLWVSGSRTAWGRPASAPVSTPPTLPAGTESSSHPRGKPSCDTALSRKR